ncbi:unnamed protein product [Prunus brigantina]
MILLHVLGQGKRDDEFDKIRGDLLRLIPLPKLEELFALV